MKCESSAQTEERLAVIGEKRESAARTGKRSAVMLDRAARTEEGS
ncbi:MAG TPA: hypothetical protein VHC22_32640 [Pirellulales bacterium]|nr:hypothetical protein [Pirellulales bacterium]